MPGKRSKLSCRPARAHKIPKVGPTQNVGPTFQSVSYRFKTSPTYWKVCPTDLSRSRVCLALSITLLIWQPAFTAEPTPRPIKPSHPPVLLTDVTLAAGIDFVETLGDEEMTNIVESAGVGCGFLDYDGDGWMDIYLVNGCWMKGLSDPKLDRRKREELARATDRLYRNRGDGTFEDVTVAAGLARPAYGMGMVVADYDDDGDPDIYVTNYGPNRLFRNNGDGTFTDVAPKLGVDDRRFSVGAAFFDYNRDGRLDLFVANYVDYDPDYSFYYAPDGFPGPLAYTGQADVLFRGNSDGTFTDVTPKAGIDPDPQGRGMGVAAFDFDNDGWLDIFVANDAMENFLWRNRGDGTFTNQALDGGVAFGENGEATAGMGVDIADYDGDGLVDLFVPDMTFSCLYRNVGGGMFEDRSARSGIAAVMGQYVGWSGVFADFDLDGHIDLYLSNGDAHHLEAHEDVLFLNDGRGHFLDVSESAGEWMNQKRVGRGAAWADFDNDGDVDLLVTHLNDRPALLRNDTPRRGRHWLSVYLVGRPSNRDAIGATVKAEVDGKMIVRQRLSGGTYLSQHDPRLHFGLGKHSRVERLQVIWPDGSRQTLNNVEGDRVITVHQTLKMLGSAGP